MVYISPKVVDDTVIAAAAEHALAEYPRESVGYVRRGLYVPMVNTVEGTDSFAVSTADEIAAYADGMEYLVHSHPTGKNTPTMSDMTQQGLSKVPWGIVVIRPHDKTRPKPEYVETFWFGDELPVAPYEGRPFRHGVFDCYSLVRDWYRQERKLVFPLFPRDDLWWKDGDDLIRESMSAIPHTQVDGIKNLKVGDVVMMHIGAAKGRSVINHLAVYSGNGLIVHHCASRFSKVEPLSMWTSHHVDSYYRYGSQ